jgi:uncharacterized protein YndB with AHSA1/START domain
MNDGAEGADARQFVITRLFNAPRRRVWQAFTEAERLAQWWGPKGFKMMVTKLDLRPGGTFHYGMQPPAGSPMGEVMWGLFVYREITPPERIVFVNSFSDEQGGITRHPMAPNWPREMLNVITFEEEDGKTRVTLRGGPIHCTPEEADTYHSNHPSMRGGFGGTFDQLDEYLAAGA